MVDSTTASFVDSESLLEGVGEPIIKNGLMFNRDTHFLYAMTPTKVSTGVVVLCYVYIIGGGGGRRVDQLPSLR